MGKVVYILDDEQEIRETLSKFLEIMGYKVFSFSEPSFCPIYHNSQCNCINDEACTDAIITDINMPGMSGLEFLEHLRHNVCKVKNIAVMSGTWTKAEHQEALEQGYKIFEKPFDLLKLKSWLEKCKFHSSKFTTVPEPVPSIPLSAIEKNQEHPCSR